LPNKDAGVINEFLSLREILTTNQNFILAFDKINWELYILINDNKFVDFNRILSQEAEIKMLIVLREKKVEYFFQFKIGSLKF
jgi:hypothetical protein